MSEHRSTDPVTLPRWKLTNYCRKECNPIGDMNGGHFERHAGGPWALVADVLPLLDELQRLRSSGGADEKPVELWRGDRKVSIYSDIVLRVWGPNPNTDMSEAPRTHESVAAAVNWLYESSGEPSGGALTYREEIQQECEDAMHSHGDYEGAVRTIYGITHRAAGEPAAEPDAMVTIDRGELWSFMRKVLSQGGDIYHDYRHKQYEEYSARLDLAARERADELEASYASTKVDKP